MINASEIREHMDVVGSDEQHVGQVDKMEGDRIKLARNDPAAGGQHHYVELTEVDRADGNRLVLKRTSKETLQSWQQQATQGGPQGGMN